MVTDKSRLLKDAFQFNMYTYEKEQKNPDVERLKLQLGVKNDVCISIPN